MQKMNETLEQLMDEQSSIGEESTEPVETMEDYAAELEASYRRVHTGDIMKGTVISVDEDGLMIDLNYFTPGKVAPEEISNNPAFDYMHEVHVGDAVDVMVLATDDGSGYMTLSVKEAAQETAWDVLKQYRDEKKELTVKITDVVPAGAVAYVENIRGFIPASRLDAKYVEDTSEYKGRSLKVRVIEVDEADSKLILSAREIAQAKEIEKKNEKVNRIKVDSVVEGTVDSLKDYGAFVDIGDGVTGLLHISQISMKRIKNPAQVLSVGQKVRVKIIKVQDGRVSLSMKELEEIAAREEEENMYDYKSEGEATTSLGSLFKNLKL